MGTGSGFLAEVAREKTQDVLAVDINPEAVAAAQQKGIRALVSNLFEQVSGIFEVIIFNPPYLPYEQDEDAESRLITTGGAEGCEILERFFQNAEAHLAPDGVILFVVSSLTPRVAEIVTNAGFRCTLLEKKKQFFEELQVYRAER